MKRLCVGLALLLFFNQVIAADNKTVIVNAKQPEFSIRLQTNNTTGYRWFIKGLDDNLIEPVGKRLLKRSSNKMGAGVVVEFKFKAKPAAFVVPRVLHISFLYARSWDLKNGTVNTFDLITDA